MRATHKRTAAVAPESGYRRPRMVDAEGLSVSVRTEDGDTRVFDFRSTGAPPDLVRPLVAAFAKMSGPAGTWRQMTTVYNGWKALRHFLKFVGKEHPNVTTITDLTDDVWKHWRSNTITATSRNAQSLILRMLLRNTEGLPGRTRMALHGRIEKHVGRQMVAYKSDEVTRIVKSAWRVFRAAEARIGASVEALDRYRAGMEPTDCVRVRFTDREWSHGEVLDHLSRTGRMPDSFQGVPRKRTGALREALGIGEEGRSYRVSLFPSPHEVYAAMILLVYAKPPRKRQPQACRPDGWPIPHYGQNPTSGTTECRPQPPMPHGLFLHRRSLKKARELAHYPSSTRRISPADSRPKPLIATMAMFPPARQPQHETTGP